MSVWRRARKSHACDWCSEDIEPGERYVEGVTFGSDAGHPVRWRCHRECSEFLDTDRGQECCVAMEDGEHWPFEAAVRGGINEDAA